MGIKNVLLLAELDPILMKLVLLAIGIVIMGAVLKLLKQPFIIAYILAGVVLGPFGFEVMTDEVLITNLGSFGLILLLFFVGMEISIHQLISNWKISIYGTLIQVGFSIGAVWLVGYFLGWPINRIIMLGFVISLSSTAVVIKLLQEREELATKVGRNVIGILLAQDIIVVPMMIVMTYLSGDSPDVKDVILQIVGGGLLIGLIIFVIKNNGIKLPFEKQIKKDHEMQVFIAFVICFGFSVIVAMFGLSPALGAFAAGILVSSAKATEWVSTSLHPFRVVFVALFFVSVGMLIDLNFLKDNIGVIMLFVLLVFITNNLINALVFKMFKVSWKESFYTGAILAQVGEFSFVLGSAGFTIGIINEYSYQLMLSIISLSLIISPVWIIATRQLTVKNSILK